MWSSRCRGREEYRRSGLTMLTEILIGLVPGIIAIIGLVYEMITSRKKFDVLSGAVSSFDKAVKSYERQVKLFRKEIKAERKEGPKSEEVKRLELEIAKERKAAKKIEEDAKSARELMRTVRSFTK